MPWRKLNGCVVPDLVIDMARQTTRKVRFVSEHHSAHLMRADWETAEPASAQSEFAVIAYAEAALPQVGAVVLSDYAKGVLTPRVIRAVIDAARRLGKPVIVDPKGHDYSMYRGATLITPNRKELAAAVHRPVATEAEIADAAAELARAIACEAVLVTRSEEGMTLHVEGDAPVHVPAYPVKVSDVSGAGDTVAAVMAVLLAMKTPFEPAMRAANAAAAVVVGKRGTATVSLAELRHRILPAASLAPEEKIVFDWSVLDERLAEWRRHGLRIGFTNGCSISCIAAISDCWPKPAPPATGWWSVSTATPRRAASRARAGRSIRPRVAPRCSPRWKRSTSSSSSKRIRRSN